MTVNPNILKSEIIILVQPTMLNFHNEGSFAIAANTKDACLYIKKTILKSTQLTINQQLKDTT